MYAPVQLPQHTLEDALARKLFFRGAMLDKTRDAKLPMAQLVTKCKVLANVLGAEGVQPATMASTVAPRSGE